MYTIAFLLQLALLLLLLLRVIAAAKLADSATHYSASH
jgi:hypothetical protein